MRRTMLIVAFMLMITSSIYGAEILSHKVVPTEVPLDVKGGGPDNYGYTWLDSNDPGGPSYDWLEIDPDSGGSGTALHFSPDYNDGYVWVGLERPFWFYGQRFDSIAVSVNGWISFVDGVESFYGTIPSTSQPNGVVAALWRDLVFYNNYGDDDSAYVAYLPDQQLTVIEWNEISKLGSWPTNFTFQIVLDHSDNTIKIQYARATDWTAARPATVGIESPDGTDGLSVPNPDRTIHDGYAIKFIPPPTVDTLEYDDGVATSDWAWDSAGYGFGERFVLPGHPLNTVVNGVFVYVPNWGGSSGSFTVLVVDDDGVNGAPGTIIFQTSAAVTSGSWNYIELGDVEDQNGIFYVFFVQEDGAPNSPALSTDSHPDLPEGFVWEYRNGEFRLSSSRFFGGDFLIRPVVAFYPRNVDAAAMWINDQYQAEPFSPVPLSGVVSHGGVINTAFYTYIDVRNSDGLVVFHDSALASPSLNELFTVNFRGWVPVDTGEYTLRMYVDCLTDPNHENDTVFSVIHVVNVHEGGPDCYNYTFKDSRAPDGPQFNWIEISGTGEPLPVGSDSFVSVALPFTFPFYSGEFDSVYVNANGAIGFQDGNVPSENSSMDEAPPWLLAAYWADLDPAANGGVYYRSFGDSVVFEWKDVPEAGEWGFNSFEIVLYSNGDIQVNYLTLPRYSDETAGIKGDSCYLQVFYDGSPYVPEDSMSVRFYRVEYEVAATSIRSPQGHLVPWRPVPVVGTVKNLGSAIANFEVRAEVVDSATGLVAWASTRTVTGLATLEERTVEFGDFTPGRDSSYTVRIYTQLVGDANPHNDTLTTSANSVMRVGDPVFGPMLLDPITGQHTHQAVEFDGRYFYITTTGNTNLLYVVDTSGAILRVIIQPTSGAGWRDMAWQEMDTGSVSGIIDTLYASTGDMIEKFAIDLNTGELISYGNFMGPMGYHRALAYSVQRRTFFAADLNSPIYEFTREDSVVRVMPNAHNIEAMAWDEGVVGDTVGYLWMAADEENDSSSHITVYQFNEATGTYTGLAITPPPLFSPSEKANGVAFWRDFNGFSTLFVVVEGDTDYITGYFVRYADQTRQVNPSVEEDQVTKPVTFGGGIRRNFVRNGLLSVQLASPQSMKAVISIYDISGRTVLTRTLHVSEGVGTYNLAVNSLPSGVYYALLNSPLGKLSFKFVVLE